LVKGDFTQLFLGVPDLTSRLSRSALYVNGTNERGN